MNTAIPFLPWSSARGTVPRGFAAALLHVCRTEGLDAVALFSGLAPRDPRPLPWPIASALLERLEALQPEALGPLAEELAGACLLACASTAPFDTEAALFDAALAEWPRFWGVLDAFIREGDGWRVVTMRLRPSYRGSTAFFRLQAEVFRRLPQQLGGAAPHVDAFVEPGGGLFRIAFSSSVTVNLVRTKVPCAVEGTRDSGEAAPVA